MFIHSGFDDMYQGDLRAPLKNDLECLQQSQQKVLRRLMSGTYTLRPLVCMDNFDILQRIQHFRVESSSHLFHGTGGYFHFLPDYLIKELQGCQSSTELDPLLQALSLAKNSAVNLDLLRPISDDAIYWNAVLKSQLARALYKHIIKDDQKRKVKLTMSPPEIEKIPHHKPKQFLFQLINAPDNSAEGVSQVFDHLAEQCGISLESMSKYIQILEGDLGTCQNVESLRKKRNPAANKEESLQNMITIPGVAHVQWNIAQSILTHHWGNSGDRKDTGVWKSWQALGGLKSKLPCNMDFGTVLQVIHKVHSATLVGCLRHTIDTWGKPVDLADEGVAQSVIDKCFDTFCVPKEDDPNNLEFFFEKYMR